MAAQCKRVFVARRQVADAEHASQSLQLVGQRNHQANLVPRQIIAGETRLVMVFDRVGHFRAQTIVEGVIAAHVPCSSGNSPTMSVNKSVLASNAAFRAFRPEVALQGHAQSRAMERTRSTRSPCVPKLVVIHNLGKPLNAGSQCLLAILVKEELGIGQARAHHALVTAITALASAGLMLLTTRNLLVNLPAPSSSGKYFWLAFIVRIRHSCGTSRNSFQTRRQHIGPLDQRRHFIQQGIVVNGFAATAHFRSSRCASWRARSRPCARQTLAITAPSFASVDA
jgi:hypothetical protein